MNDEFFIQEVEHEPKKPVSIEREPNDVVVIEGVRYAADLFRIFANPDVNLLYALQRDGDRVVVKVIRNGGEALGFFFQNAYKPPSAKAAFPQIEEHDLGEEDQGE